MNNLREGKHPATVCAPRSGDGFVELTRVGDKTAVTACRSASPLKILAPSRAGDTAWIFTSTYGGGLLGGDSIELKVRAGPNTRTLLSTQASTKVYRTSGRGSRQNLFVRIEDDAMFVSAPDPVVCFKDADFSQQQTFTLAPRANLIAIDWFSSGRWANGERWVFQRYQSHTEIVINDRCIFRDVLLLDPADGPVGGAMRMGSVNCFATVVIAGHALVDVIAEVLKVINSEPARADGTVLFSASPFEKGAVVRVTGKSCQIVGSWIRNRLHFVPALIEQDPWARKW